MTQTREEIEALISKPIENMRFEEWIVKLTEAIRQLLDQNREILSVVEELEESYEYWSEYDVPIGIKGRIRSALAKVKGRK